MVGAEALLGGRQEGSGEGFPLPLPPTHKQLRVLNRSPAPAITSPAQSFNRLLRLYISNWSRIRCPSPRLHPARTKSPWERAPGSGRGRERRGAVRYAGVVSEWRGDERGAREGQRRVGRDEGGVPPLITSGVPPPPGTPSSGSFDLGKHGAWAEQECHSRTG